MALSLVHVCFMWRGPLRVCYGYCTSQDKDKDTT